MFNRAICGIVGGMVLAMVGSALFTRAMVYYPQMHGQMHKTLIYIRWALGFVLAIGAPTGAKAWRRLLLICGIGCLGLPLVAIVSTGAGIATTIPADPSLSDAAEATGRALGGGVVAALSGFVGFFLGAIFLVAGFAVGRNKTVVVIREPDPKK